MDFSTLSTIKSYNFETKQHLKFKAILGALILYAVSPNLTRVHILEF